MSNLLNVNICGCPVINLDPWELMRWILQKVLTGSQLNATAVYMGKTITGQLKPYSIDRTQTELTRSCLVYLITEEGRFILNCKYLKEIDLLHLQN